MPRQRRSATRRILWVVYIDHPSRYPTWDEVKVARYRLLPDAATVAMLLPPAGEFVNGERFTFHLSQISVGRHESREAAATHVTTSIDAKRGQDTAKVYDVLTVTVA